MSQYWYAYSGNDFKVEHIWTVESKRSRKFGSGWGDLPVSGLGNGGGGGSLRQGQKVPA